MNIGKKMMTLMLKWIGCTCECKRYVYLYVNAFRVFIADQLFAVTFAWQSKYREIKYLNCRGTHHA